MTLSRIPSLQNQTNALLIDEFYQFLKKNNKSETWQDNNLKTMIHFSERLAVKYPDLTLYDINKPDKVVEFLDSKMKSIEVDPDKKWLRTWNDYLEKLTYFFRWMHNVKLASEPDKIPQRDWKTPPFIEQIKRKQIKRVSPYTSAEIWELDEYLLATKYESNLERRAAERMLWDLDARNKDITLIKRKNIRFKPNYAEGDIPPEAKTGSGPFVLTVSFTDVRDWYNMHPFKYPEARLICDSTGKPIESDQLRDWMYELRENIAKMLESGMIKDEGERQKLSELVDAKKWNPYCIRHSAISYDSDYLPEFAVRKKVRWSMNSRQPARYIKNKMSSQLTNTILAHNGIITEEAAKPKPRVLHCGKCKEVNSIENKLCSKCSYPLTFEAFEEIKRKEESELAAVKEDVRILKLVVTGFINSTLDGARPEQMTEEEYEQLRAKNPNVRRIYLQEEKEPSG